MASVAKDISDLLTSITSDIWIDEMPNNPDNILTVFNSNSGNPSEHFIDSDLIIYNPQIEIMVRHKSRETALDWIDKIKRILDGKYHYESDTKHYLQIFLQSNETYLGRDNITRNGRYLYSLTFDIYYQFI